MRGQLVPLFAAAVLLASLGTTSRVRTEETLSKTWSFDSDLRFARRTHHSPNRNT
jgi:hypothetical protein